jgi:hypothetical protein
VVILQKDKERLLAEIVTLNNDIKEIAFEKEKLEKVRFQGRRGRVMYDFMRDGMRVYSIIWSLLEMWNQFLKATPLYEQVLACNCFRMFTKNQSKQRPKKRVT